MVEESISSDRREQKVLFAKDYHINKGEAVLIAARILGDEAVDNPMLAINFGNTWPFDPIVQEEITRLEHLTQPKGSYVAQARKWAEDAHKFNEFNAAERLLRLAAQIDGHITTGKSAASESTDGNGHEIDLLEALGDPNNKRENDVPQVPATWR